MTKLEKKLNDGLKNINTICFGPLVGEFGWEVALLSGFIRKYREQNPNKKIIVCTRNDRQDLYLNHGFNEIITFNIPFDYEKFTPRGNGLYSIIKEDKNHGIKKVDVKEQFKALINTIKERYDNNIHIQLFDDILFSTSPIFDIANLNYNFTPNKPNTDVIQNIISKNPNKKVVTIFSRYRKDLDHRNWSESNWKDLFKKLSKLKDYIFFISGTSPSFIKPIKRYTNMYVLEDIQSNFTECTTLGLCIEAIKHSNFTFGPQTAGILLSNFLKIPVISFGLEENLVNKLYNPFGNKLKFHKVKYGTNYSYETEVNNLYDLIVNYDNQLIEENIQKEVILKRCSVHPIFSQIKDPKLLKEKIKEFNMRTPQSHRTIPLVEVIDDTEK